MRLFYFYSCPSPSHFHSNFTGYSSFGHFIFMIFLLAVTLSRINAVLWFLIMILVIGSFLALFSILANSAIPCLLFGLRIGYGGFDRFRIIVFVIECFFGMGLCLFKFSFNYCAFHQLFHPDLSIIHPSPLC